MGLHALFDEDDVPRLPFLDLELPTTSLLFGLDLVIFSRRAEEQQLLDTLKELGATVRNSFEGTPQEFLIISQKGTGFQETFPDIPIVLDHGDFLLVRAGKEEQSIISAGNPGDFLAYSVSGDQKVYAYSNRVGSPPAVEPWVFDLVNRVSSKELASLLGGVVSKKKTRHSLSKGYKTAARLCQDLFEDWGYSATQQKVTLPSGTTTNVIADTKAKAPEEGVFLVTAHLDSINGKYREDPDRSAPGFDDNASGSASLLHIAQLLSGHSPKRHIRFVLFGGEEQCLAGSIHYLKKLSEVERKQILGVLNMDMVGRSTAERPGVNLFGDSALVDALDLAAWVYSPNLSISLGTAGPEGDHDSFASQGIPAVLATERGSNPDWHRSTDKYVDYSLVAQVTRMSLAATALAIGQLR